MRELVSKMAGAGVEVRLEEDEHAPRPRGVPSSRQGGRDLAGVVAIVVVDGDPARFPAPLEPAPHARELGQDALGVVALDSCELKRGQRRRGVASVVLAGKRELEVDRLQLVPPDGFRRQGKPPVEELPYLVLRREGRMVVEVDVGEDRDPRAQQLEGAVRLVALCHEPTLSGAGVPVQLRDLAADQERGVEPEPVEHEGDHPRGRRLAVGAGNHDRGAHRDELREQLPAPERLGVARARDF